jgi:LacI family transcriptional regulator
MAFPRKREKIAEAVRRWIADGKLRPGDRFPSDQELARRFRVTHMTVRSALKPLVESGVLERRIGFGTVVRKPPVDPGESAASFLAGAVGVCIPANTHSFFSEVLRAVEGELFATSRPMLLAHHWEVADREEAVVRSWVRQGLRNVLMVPIIGRAAFYRSLVDEGVRLVFVDRLEPEVDVPAVTSDDRPAAAALTRLLFDLGHRRVIHIAGPRVASTAEERRAGFLDACAAAGVKDGAGRVVEAGFFIDDGHRAMKQLLERAPEPPEAVFCANDPIAVGAVRALAERGLDVPRDVSVAGYGDSDLGRNLNLTTARQFPERLGAEAVRLLLSREPLSASRSIRVTPEVIVRTSTAAR